MWPSSRKQHAMIPATGPHVTRRKGDKSPPTPPSHEDAYGLPCSSAEVFPEEEHARLGPETGSIGAKLPPSYQTCLEKQEIKPMATAATTRTSTKAQHEQQQAAKTPTPTNENNSDKRNQPQLSPPRVTPTTKKHPGQARTLAKPKSVTLRYPSRSSSKFSGFRSR